jgi:16S rRNA (guanine527-N7)-methyltransferase
MSPTGSWSSKPTDEGAGAGLSLPDARIERWLDRLLETPGLTAIRDPAEARKVHLDGSLAVVPLVRCYGGPVVDVGSGGGAPGVPIAAALPDREVVLLDATRRKCDFLASILAEFPNARVVCGRAEEQPNEQFGVAVARALAPPPVAVEWCLPLVVTGGAAILLVGPSADVDAVGRAAAQLGGGQPEQHDGILVVPKLTPTPPGFPRRPGVARKRPLA